MIGQTLSSDGGRRAVWAVAVAIALGVTAWAWLRAPRGFGESDDARVAAIELVEPVGALAASPKRFAWRPVRGAASYDVRIADDDAVWPLFVRSTVDASLSLTANEAVALSPGRVHIWEVDAKDASGTKLASGSARFRVLVPGAAPE